VPSTVGAVAAAASGRCSGSHVRWADAVCSDLSLKPSPGRCQGITRNLFVDMDCLCMLTQVVESRESAGTVTFEGSFARMFSAEYQYETHVSLELYAYRMCRARCSLRVKLRLHGGKSVQ
jgi:hypothetical protein